MGQALFAYQLKLSPWLSKLNQLLISVLFYLIDLCQWFICRWMIIPVSVEPMKCFRSGFRRVGAVTFKVTELSASVTLCRCGCCTDIHGLTSSSVSGSHCCLLCRYTCRCYSFWHRSLRRWCWSSQAFCLFEAPVVVDTE